MVEGVYSVAPTFQVENAIEYHVITGVYLYLGTCKQPLLFVPWETWVILRGT